MKKASGLMLNMLIVSYPGALIRENILGNLITEK